MHKSANTIKARKKWDYPSVIFECSGAVGRRVAKKVQTRRGRKWVREYADSYEPQAVDDSECLDLYEYTFREECLDAWDAMQAYEWAHVLDDRPPEDVWHAADAMWREEASYLPAWW